MPLSKEEEHKRLIEHFSKDIDRLEDGFFYYFVKGGALPAHMLRTIADELDRRNEPIAQQMDHDLRVSDEEQSRRSKLRPEDDGSISDEIFTSNQ